MRFALPCAILLLAAAAPLHAQTYKWVDANGVTNYSATPPAGKASKPRVIEERISVVASDPSLGPAIAAMRARAERRAEYAEAEWLQRQRLMLAAQTVPAPEPCPYRADCTTEYVPYADPYFYAPVLAVRSRHRFAPAHVHRTRARVAGAGAAHTTRGPLR